MHNLGSAAIVLCSTVFFNSFKNKYIRMSSIVIGPVIGYIAARLMGRIDFSLISWLGVIFEPAGK
jgi:xanthine permease XanP